MMTSTKPSAMRGFTLLEMAVVAIIIGFFSMLVLPQVKSAQYGALADKVMAITQKSTQMHDLLVAQGISDRGLGTMLAPGLGTGGWTSLLVYGRDALLPQYQPLYDESGAKPLYGLVGQDIYGSNYFMVEDGSGMSFTANGQAMGGGDSNAGTFYVRFSEAPINLVAVLLERIKSGMVPAPEYAGANYPAPTFMYYCQQGNACDLQFQGR